MFNGPLRLRRQPNFKEKVEITKGDHVSVQVGVKLPLSGWGWVAGRGRQFVKT